VRAHRWLPARNDAAAAVKRAERERLMAREPSPAFAGTVSRAVDLIGQYRDAGIELLIYADRPNDVESRELFASEVIPHFG
jgi:hypothetical protein